MAYFLFIIVVVSVSGIYNIRGVLSPQVLKFLFYLACAASLCYAYVKGRKLDAFDYPRKSYLLLLLSIVLSAFSASLFHEQSIKSSLIVILPQLMSYMMFWTWMKFGLTEKQIMKFLIVLCLVNVPVYFVNAMTFPNFLFGSVDAFGEYGEDTSRGILRLPVYYIEVYVLLLFYGINKILVKPSLKWYVLIGVFALMIVLSVMRKMMFLSAVLGLVMYLRNSSWLKRILISCAVGSVYFFVLPQIPMYQEMVALSEKDRKSVV